MAAKKVAKKVANPKCSACAGRGFTNTYHEPTIGSGTFTPAKMVKCETCGGSGHAKQGLV